MPFGITQSVLGTGARENQREDSTTGPRKSGHYGGETRATSTTFSGVMRALLKPTAPAPAPASSAQPVSAAGAAERPTWQPRTALDASGHSFSKTLKAEVLRSKIQKQNGENGGSSSGRSGRWERPGGRDLDDAMSRAGAAPSSTIAPSQQHQAPLHLHHRQQPRTAQGTAPLRHLSSHQAQTQGQPPQQQAQRLCRRKTNSEKFLDEISRAVGLQ